jgi:hypothetical protein
MVASSIILTPVPTPTSSLSIAGRAGHAFTPHAMMQGFACHARGVELPTSGPSRVHARVRSKRVHDVHLRAERGKLVVACSSPARSFGLEVCKHVWAALLEVDRHDGLADLRGSRGPLVVEPAPAPARPSGEEGTSETTRASAVHEGTPVGEARPNAKPRKTLKTPKTLETPDAGKTGVKPVKERAAARRAAETAGAPTAPQTKELAKTSAAPKERLAKPTTSKEERRDAKKAPGRAAERAAAPAKGRTSKRRR